MLSHTCVHILKETVSFVYPKCFQLGAQIPRTLLQFPLVLVVLSCSHAHTHTELLLCDPFGASEFGR